MTALVVISWILLTITAMAMMYWLIFLLRVIRIQLTRPTVRRGLAGGDPEGGWPSVSVVVPAHNEERVIERCVRSILDQAYPDLELIVVLDRCTDRTRALLDPIAAEDDRLTLLSNESCPPDWAGKCHAARLGARQARGDRLLFIDADTCCQPELFTSAIRIADTSNIALLSLLSTLTCEHYFERTAQPVASMALMTLYPPDLVNREPKGRPFANGQFMLFNRESYESIGGHDAVKDDLLEDIAFARCISHDGGRVNILNADGMFTCSMYSSIESFRTGWLRIFIEACKRKPARLRKMARRVFLTGVLLPLVFACGVGVGVVTALTPEDVQGVGISLVMAALMALVLQWVALAIVYRMGHQPISAVWRHPMGCFEVSRILRRAAGVLVRGEPVVWAGKSYVLEAR
ncbi:MAG: glycosyltransferase family 2 protein [Phycisphaerales bacterium]|nr:glycosyltransferase family 2 protein [Phycisphaerales bacterium]